LCVTSFSLQRPRRARDSILPFNLPRSRSLTQTLAFLPLPPQPDPLHSPLPFGIYLSACSRTPPPPPHRRAAVSVAPASDRGYQKLRIGSLVIPIELLPPGRLQSFESSSSSSQPAVGRHRNSSSPANLWPSRPPPHLLGELPSLSHHFPVVFW
jgi:hypothetical protein